MPEPVLVRQGGRLRRLNGVGDVDALTGLQVRLGLGAGFGNGA